MSNIIPFTTRRTLPGFTAPASAGHGEAKPAVTKQPVKLLDLSAILSPPALTPHQIRTRGYHFLEKLTGFIGASQLATIKTCLRGEEGQWFMEKMESLAALVQSMPKTYETNGQGDDAICHLHYFGGSYDGYLIEKDSEESADPAEAQWQAFGFVHWAHMPGDAECGYICLPEIFKSHIEIDLHFTPTPLREIKRKHGAAESPPPQGPAISESPACDAPTGQSNMTPTRDLHEIWQHLSHSTPAESILFLHVGDFYETFESHARIAAPILNVTLTKRNTVPMCGFPVHAESSYLNRLLELGKTLLMAAKGTDGEWRILRTLTPPAPEDPIATRQKTFLALPDGYQSGAIIYCSWGYEQTNINFYRIEKRAGDFVTLIPLRQRDRHETHYLSGTVLPSDTPKDYAKEHDPAWSSKDMEKPKPTFRRKLNIRDGTVNGLNVFGCGWASLWNGIPMTWSSYA